MKWTAVAIKRKNRRKKNKGWTAFEINRQKSNENNNASRARIAVYCSTSSLLSRFSKEEGTVAFHSSSLLFWRCPSSLFFRRTSHFVLIHPTVNHRTSRETLRRQMRADALKKGTCSQVMMWRCDQKHHRSSEKADFQKKKQQEEFKLLGEFLAVDRNLLDGEEKFFILCWDRYGWRTSDRNISWRFF